MSLRIRVTFTVWVVQSSCPRNANTERETFLIFLREVKTVLEAAPCFLGDKHLVVRLLQMGPGQKWKITLIKRQEHFMADKCVQKINELYHR